MTENQILCLVCVLLVGAFGLYLERKDEAEKRARKG